MTGSRAPRLSVATILNPRSVAVVGASEDLRKFGSRVLKNTIHGGFAGRIIPVNPRREHIFGLPAVASVDRLANPVDVAVIAVPRTAVRDTITQCAAIGVGCCVIITAGFSEIDAAGADLQEELVQIARRAGMRLIGPNCLGLLNTHAGLLLNSSPAMTVTPFHTGAIAHLSQSGALMATTYNRGVEDQARFSTAVSLGNQADLELCDFIEYLAGDSHTRVITLYVEGFKDPQRFVEAVRRCRSAGKPVLMVKAGTTEVGARVTRSHTASLASTQRVLEAVCREEGVLLLDDMRGMMQSAEVFARFGVPAGDGICVISGSGGAGALCADRLAERSLRLASFSIDTREKLETLFEPSQLGNPLDMGALREKSFTHVGDGGLAIAAADPDVSAVLVPITTGPMLGEFARAMVESIRATGKPALFVVIQGSADDGAREILKQEGMLVFETLDEAFRVLECWMAASMFPAAVGLPERPPGLPEKPVNHELPLLPTEHEVKTLVARYGIATVHEQLAGNPDDAAAVARKVGYPVALKASCRSLVHKSDVGGVFLSLEDEQALRAAWDQITQRLGPDLESCLICRMEPADAEMILGISHDPEFGPMVLFGLGGLVAEIVDDVVLTPAPVDPQRVLALLQTLKLWPLLNGARGRQKLDTDAVCNMISRLSWLGDDLRDMLLELDLNPVMVRRQGEGAVAVDARATLKTASQNINTGLSSARSD